MPRRDRHFGQIAAVGAHRIGQAIVGTLADRVPCAVQLDDPAKIRKARVAEDDDIVPVVVRTRHKSIFAVADEDDLDSLDAEFLRDRNERAGVAFIVGATDVRLRLGEPCLICGRVAEPQQIDHRH